MCTPLIVIASTSLTRYVAKWDINCIDLNHDEAGKKEGEGDFPTSFMEQCRWL